jgi:hypothetical protein
MLSSAANSSLVDPFSLAVHPFLVLTEHVANATKKLNMRMTDIGSILVIFFPLFLETHSLPFWLTVADETLLTVTKIQL